MNGRFPHDVFAIILLPFVAVGTSLFLTPLFIPAHVHHRLAVGIAIAIGGLIALVAIVVRVRRRRHSARKI